MFSKLLIANRGEIAIRIMRACRDLGVKSIAVYSDADREALHVRLADEAYYIGESPASESYLNGERIIQVALEANAEAIHPGYGFLSENADFAEMVENSGLVFVGPRSDTIRKVGNKDAARRAMALAGLPMVPGTDPLTSIEDACEKAEKIGYPVILKPVAGGGGNGMFVCHNHDELVTKGANIPFNGEFYLERYVANARHIEVQVMADNFGHIVHLGERECSLQRRNQKILEECPSGGLTSELRQKVGTLAIQAAKSVAYTNIGTVEFLWDQETREFYFMEINPRVQVEHGITELVTGMNIVRKQIRLAADEPLNLKQEHVRINGYAIECRINAEDPAMNFMPSPGTITFYHQPGGPDVRVDSGVCAGSTVEPYYDSLIAKVLVRGKTRGDAIRLMRRALEEFKIEGIKTTIDFHRAVLKNSNYRRGNIDTQFVQKNFS